MRSKIFISILTVIVLLTGCKKISSVPDPQQPDPGGPPLVTPIGTPVGTPVSKTIGSGGGSLISPDGRLELNIPAGALNSNTNITIQPVTNEAPGGLGLAYDLLPDGTKFSKPVMLTFHYTDSEVPDNVPYFCYIAYQDSSRAWKVDFEQRDFDSVAKTVSLEVNHFTNFSFITTLGVSAIPLVLGEHESTWIRVIEAVMDRNGRITVTGTIDKKFIDVWKVNGNIDGNNTDGRILFGNTLPNAMYRSPDRIDIRRKVRVSVLLKGKFDVITRGIYKKGKRIDLVNVERAVDITLEPPKEYNYHMSIIRIDSNISTFYGGLRSGLPVYYDTAKFDLNIKIINDKATGTISDTIKNSYPAVKPSVAIHMGTEFVWLPDPVGVIDVKGIDPATPLPPDSIVSFVLVHGNAYWPGAMYRSARDFSIYTNVAPKAFGKGDGLPYVFDVDLKKRGPYISREGAFGTWIFTEVKPK